jgi:hypothetical protein
LKIGKAQEFDDGRVQGYRITVEVIEAVGLVEEIFVYQRMTLVQGNAPQDDFSNVASPADLEEYPLSEPTEDSPFFRLKTIELVYRDLELLNENLNDLKRDICMLLDSLAHMDQLIEEIVVIDERCAAGAVDPCPPPPPITARVVSFARDPTVTDDALAGYGTGSLWTNTVTGDVFTLIDNQNGEAQWQLVAGTLSQLNKSMAANVTTADGQLATNTPIAALPFRDSYIIVTVDGHEVEVGNGVKTLDCYFSSDLGVSALQFSAIAVGAQLFWNGSIAGYQLEVDDIIAFNYIV